MAGNALDVKASVVTLVAALNPAWDTSWGFKRSPDKTYVYIGEVQWEQSRWVTNRSLEESFNIKVVINHKTRRGTAESVERFALDVSEQIQAAVKANPNLGNAAVVTSVYRPRRADSWPSDDFVEAQVEGEINVTARF